MEPVLLEHFPHGNWTEIDDETWQGILDDMNPTRSKIDSLQDKKVFSRDGELEQDSNGSHTGVMKYQFGKARADPLRGPTSPSFTSTLSAEADREARSVPRPSEGNDRSTMKNLPGSRPEVSPTYDLRQRAVSNRGQLRNEVRAE